MSTWMNFHWTSTGELVAATGRNLLELSPQGVDSRNVRRNEMVSAPEGARVRERTLAAV